MRLRPGLACHLGRGALAFAGAALLLATAPAQTPSQMKLAIVGADVLPMTGPDRLIDQTVIVEGDRIVAVGPEGAVAVPSGAKRINGHGLTLMPGLVDMHVHLPHAIGQLGDETQRMLAVMLAYGVTTVRGMQGAPNDLIAREAVEQGRIAGPRIYAATMPINDDSAATPEAAREIIRDGKLRGFDLVKSHNINKLEVWKAVQDEARRQGLPTAGHITNVVGLDRALAAGQEVEHLDGSLYDLLPRDAPERKIDWAQLPPPEVMTALSHVTDAQIQTLARKVADAHGFQVPTVAMFERVVSLDRPTSELAQAPEMRFVPRSIVKDWTEQREQLRQNGFMKGETSAFIQLRRKVVKAFADAGVGIMAGSDTPQNFRIPGPGLITELEALKAAGLTPMQVLRSATVVPRDYFRTLSNGGSALGWKADFGTVQPGARADLILVHGDPLRDLSALKKMETVIAGGRLYNRSALDALLDAAASAANPSRRLTTKFEPIIAKVAAAFEKHSLVGIGDGTHREQQAHDLHVALIRDPRVLCRIDMIAVEFGNSALQPIADRYVAGEPVSLSEKRSIWRDTGQWLVWDSPIYEDFFEAIRALNQRELCPKPVRVLLADPPINWSQVHNGAEYRPYRIRDEFAAQLIEHEVLAKGKKALLIFGDTHLWKVLPKGSVEKPRMGMILEQHRPGSLASFTFTPDIDHQGKAQLPPAPSLTLLHGTRLGRQPLRRLMPHDDTLAMKEGGKVVERALDEVVWPPAERLVDGFINLGPLTDADPDPAIYRDPAYQAELRRRAPILKEVHGFDFAAQLRSLLSKSE